MALRPLHPTRGLLALVAAGSVASAQSDVKDSNPGYIVFKVNLTTTGIAGQPGGMPGGGGGLPGGLLGGEGGEGRGGFGGFPQPGGFAPPGGVPGQPGVPPPQPSQYAVAVVPYYKILNRAVDVRKAPSGPLGSNPKFLSLQITNDPRTATATSPFLYADGVLIQVYPMRRALPDQQLALKTKAWQTKGRPLDGVDGLTELISDSLAAGLPDKAAEFFAELAKAVKTRKEGVPDRVARAAKAFDEVNPTLGQPLPDDPDAQKWKDRLGAADVSTLGTEHYAIVHFGDQLVGPETLQRRAEMLECNYKSFYLWNALQGRSLKPPAKRLTVVLVGKSSELPRLRDALDGGGVVTDGFYSPTQHLLVMAPERTDDIARAFNRYLQNNWQAGWSRDDLLKGKSPAVGPKGKPAEEVYRMMTLALVDRKLEEDGEYATISREGTRQLYAATGVLPTYVAMPTWVESGAVNLLAKLKGPVINQAVPPPGTPPPDPSQPQQPPASITVALSPGYGGPNYVLLRKWRDMIQRKEFANSTYASILKNTISDKYFDAVQSGVDPDAVLQAGPAAPGELALTVGTPTGAAPGYGGYPMGPGGFGPMGPGMAPPGVAPGAPVLGADPAAEKRALTAKLDLKAQAISWALTYFLNKAHGDKLQAFYAALGRMPRDMHLDPALVTELFCKTFGLTTPDGAVDDAKLTAFATDWLRFMNAVPQVGVDIPYTAFGIDPNAPQTPGFGGFGPTGGP